MPKHTINLSAKTEVGLQIVVSEHNVQQGTTLTLDQWLLLHLQEVAVARQLQATVTALIEQHQRDAQAALEATIKSARDELLASLAV
jgi:ribosomal protein L21